MTGYNKVKFVFYSIGIFLTFVFFDSDEIRSATHTPPLSFVLPFIISFIGSIWLLFDAMVFVGNKMVNKEPKELNMSFIFHIVGIGVPVAICIMIYKLH